ncbi:MAG: DNA primase [Methanomassiliicoccus sp.]|nr:DNA primase [Methanomassiliicoccus sp.]
MNIDPSTTKYMIKARLQADGIVEKPDVVGAIFGQTEGLLGDELDLRDLQKSGRIGRIEVEVSSKQGKSDGEVLIPSSLDQVETVILASALETIDRVGPCKAKINVLSIEDVRITKRSKIIERARELLTELIKQSKTTGIDLTESVRQSVQTEEIINYGKERLPAGPNVQDSDAIIVVEGRSDVLNLLKSGIKNAIAVEGTNVPKTVMDLSKERVITAFVDGDRGGELILRELFQVAEVDFVARAPRGMEVEELTQKQIMKCLRNKIPGEQFMEMYGMTSENGKAAAENREERGPREQVREPREQAREQPREQAREQPREQAREREEAAEARERPQERPPERDQRPHREPRDRRGREPREIREPREPIKELPAAEPVSELPEKAVAAYEPEPAEPEPTKKLSEAQALYKTIINELSATSKAKILDASGEVMKEVPVRDLVNTLKTSAKGVNAVVFDGIVTQRILDIAADNKIATIVGTKMGNIAKQPAAVEIWTKEDLNE